jgi:POT family proton-dependent oligopeptide transporter
MAAAPAGSQQWFGQPPGLTILFLTQMWEEFSYYGMRTLLVFYLTLGLHYSPAQASLIYGIYSGSAYFTPLIGGAIADRWLGHRRAVLIGGVVMALGHFAMAFPALLFPALGVIALGNGLFLPCLPAQIGDLYAADDPRRGAAYTVYYAGLNLGAVLAPLICGILGETLGWHYGFGAAGIGMLLGVAIYSAGWRHLPARRPTKPERAGSASEAPRQVVLLFAILAAVVLFRGAYEQAGNSIALWTADAVDRHVAGLRQIPATWFQALDPLFVFLLTPLIVRRARRAAGAGNPARTMAAGAVLIAAAFAMLGAVAWWNGRTGAPVNWLWLVAFFAVYTWGELQVLPTGLALFGRLSPAGRSASSMGFWFSGIFAGNLLAGLLGTLSPWFGAPLFFAAMAAIAAASGVAFAFLVRPTAVLMASHQEGREGA